MIPVWFSEHATYVLVPSPSVLWGQLPGNGDAEYRREQEEEKARQGRGHQDLCGTISSLLHRAQS